MYRRTKKWIDRTKTPIRYKWRRFRFKEKIIIEIKEVFKEIPFGIEHTLKVLKNAEDIMKGENIGEEEKEFISITAILHDIGAVEAQKKRMSQNSNSI